MQLILVGVALESDIKAHSVFLLFDASNLLVF